MLNALLVLGSSIETGSATGGGIYDNNTNSYMSDIYYADGNVYITWIDSINGFPNIYLTYWDFEYFYALFDSDTSGGVSDNNQDAWYMYPSIIVDMNDFPIPFLLGQILRMGTLMLNIGSELSFVC